MRTAVPPTRPPVDPTGSSGVDGLSRALHSVIRGLKCLHAAVLEQTGLRVELPALAMLTTLADEGRQRPSALADRLRLDLSSVSRQATSLEREGWVERERDPVDMRAQLLGLTGQGHAVVERVRDVRGSLLRERLPDWTDHELDVFAAALRRFARDVSSPAQVTLPPDPLPTDPLPTDPLTLDQTAPAGASPQESS